MNTMLRAILAGAIAFAGLVQPSKGQNLVPNPSFETYISCPNSTFQYNRVATWTNPNSASPEYFNACGSGGGDVPSNSAGNQLARTGDAYIGQLFTWLSSNYREYGQVQLTAPLVAGQMYRVEYYVSLADGSSYASDKFHAYFSASSTTNGSTNNLPFVPSVAPAVGFIGDKVGWQRVCGEYVAVGGERYLIIGNFFTSVASPMVNIGAGLPFCSSGGYYYTDDVAVVPGNCGILPADISQFSGEVVGPGEVALHWRTDAERQVLRYEIERSSATESFAAVGELQGGGTLPMGQEYSFRDYPSTDELFYYRLRIYDADGTSAYSEAIPVNLDAGTRRIGVHQAYPTSLKAGQEFTIRWYQPQAGKLRMEWTDLAGKMAVSKTIDLQEGITHFTTPTGDMQPGIYLVRLISNLGSEVLRVQVR